MKRHVLEIASDARTLEEKLNSLGDHLVFETMVWANGKLFVVIREYSPNPAKAEARRKDEPKWHWRKRGGKNRELPKEGEPLRKDQR